MRTFLSGKFYRVSLGREPVVSGRLGRPLFGARQTVNTSTAIEQAMMHALYSKSDVATDVWRLMRKRLYAKN